MKPATASLISFFTRLTIPHPAKNSELLHFNLKNKFRHESI